MITHAHNRHWYALNERFRHAQLRAHFKRCRLFEITSFVVTAAEAANLILFKFFTLFERTRRFYACPEIIATKKVSLASFWVFGGDARPKLGQTLHYWICRMANDTAKGVQQCSKDVLRCFVSGQYRRRQDGFARIATCLVFEAPAGMIKALVCAVLASALVNQAVTGSAKAPAWETKALAGVIQAVAGDVKALAWFTKALTGGTKAFAGGVKAVAGRTKAVAWLPVEAARQHRPAVFWWRVYSILAGRGY